MAYDIVSKVPSFIQVFLGEIEIEGGIAFPEKIERERMDFSINSLTALDHYLDHLHSHVNDIEEQAYVNSVLAAGCYLGEVMRRHSKVKLNWVNYEDYFPSKSDLADKVPNCLGTGAVLVTPTGEMTMPLNKIIRYIDEGSVHNTKFYASIMDREG